MKLYRFSPISSENELDKAFEYIAENIKKLGKKVLRKDLPITTLKIFPHYFEEYKYLKDVISKRGQEAPFNSTTSYYVEVKQEIGKHKIDYLGVRVVDPYRLQVGCGDFEVKDLNEFRNKYLNTSKYIRNVKKDMLEIWHPDYDVLGYTIQAE